jgi:magnesium-transporting ATPase (P-type)
VRVLLAMSDLADEQARISFERMQSYAIFRISETIRIVSFMTVTIVVLKFYPITALMIILLALLNDIPIFGIAYDHTLVAREPVRWNMAELITLASVLGVAGAGAVLSHLRHRSHRYRHRRPGLANDSHRLGLRPSLVSTQRYDQSDGDPVSAATQWGKAGTESRNLGSVS